MKSKFIKTLVVLGIFSAQPIASYAQGDASGEEAKSGNMDTVTVMARKRAESLQEVPLAVTAIRGQEFAATFSQDARDLDGLIPNVVMDEAIGSGVSVGNFYIRGIGSQDPDSSIDPVAVVVIDGFAMGRNNGNLVDLFDVEQIEIIRGPQGTMFGRNTIAGVINIRTARPDSEEFAARIKGEIGNFGRRDLNLMVNAPLIEGVLGMRFSGVYKHSDGWYTNLADGEDIGGDDLFAGRLHFLLTPNDRFEALLTLELVRDRSDLPIFENFSTDDRFLSILFGNPGSTDLEDPYVVFTDTFKLGGFDKKNFYNAFGAYLNLEYD